MARIKPREWDREEYYRIYVRFELGIKATNEIPSPDYTSAFIYAAHRRGAVLQ